MKLTVIMERFEVMRFERYVSELFNLVLKLSRQVMRFLASFESNVLALPASKLPISTSTSPLAFCSVNTIELFYNVPRVRRYRDSGDTFEAMSATLTLLGHCSAASEVGWLLRTISSSMLG